MRNPKSAQVAEGDTRSTPVSTVMTVDPITIDPDADLWSALRTLLRTGLRHLVVEDVDGVYCGILADRHVVAAWPAEAIGALGTLVRQMVRDPAPSILSTTTVAVAARAMLQAGTDALAVVDTAGRVQGIVTGSNLIRVLADVSSVRALTRVVTPATRSRTNASG